MITYRTETDEFQVMDKFVCDKCKAEVSGCVELQEALSIRTVGGYGSVFGDGIRVGCDLCQRCLKELIGEFCVYNAED